MKRWIAILLCWATLLSLCACGAQPESSPVSAAASPPSEQPAVPEPPVFADPAEELPATQDYIRQVVQEHIDRIQQPGMTEYEKVKAAADYIMALGYYARPVALDVWRWRTAGDTSPSYEEMRGLNMLLFGVETCEGYAASLNLLLNGMGIETRYMTGMTYLSRGGLGYHSWSQVKIDGIWYHLDCELEDGIARDDGNVIYRYFLKSDATMSASHFWGQRLLDLGQLEPGQQAAVRAHYMGENCPQDYPTPSPTSIPVNPQPDIEALREELTTELEEYEARYGPLEYRELDILPPVFIQPYDENGEPTEDHSNRVWEYRQTRQIIPPPEQGFPEGEEVMTTVPDTEVATTQITMTVGNTVITAELEHSETTQAFLDTLPRTLSMTRYNDREYYGRISSLPENGEVIPDFENGDVTYYPAGPSFAVFFDGEERSSQNGLIRMGKITSDLSAFAGLEDSVEMKIEIAG